MQKNLGRVSIVPKGVWSESASYARLDAVVHNGSSFLAKKPSKGVAPAEGAYWQLLAAKGQRGDRGDDGVSVTADGFFAFKVNEAGHLILSYADATEVPDFTINEAGHLIYKF